MKETIVQINEIKKMLDDGFINESEFNSLKKEILKDSDTWDKSEEFPITRAIEETQPKEIQESVEQMPEKLENVEEFRGNYEYEQEYENSELFREINYKKKKQTLVLVALAIFLIIICGFIWYLTLSKNTRANTTEIYLIDTSFKMGNEHINLKVLRNKDSNQIVTANYDDQQTAVSINSNRFSIFIEGVKNDKRISEISLELLMELAKQNRFEISKNKEILDSTIEFLGYTDEFLMFNFNTYIPNGEGGGKWTIGIPRTESIEPNAVKLSCVLMEYFSPWGDDIHIKNNRFFISRFLGFWSGDCTSYFTVININNKDNYATVCVQGNQIEIYARMETDSYNPNKMTLYLPEGDQIGDMGSGGSMQPWDEYSRKKPIAEIISVPEKKNELIVNWYGFYNIKTNRFEWGDAEFLKTGSNTLIRCNP